MSSIDEREKLLIEKLTDDFLTTLREAGELRGWEGDAIEIQNFIDWCFRIAGKDCPDFNPVMWNER